VALAAVLLVMASCGSPTLWARYRAEREFWHARRLVERVQVNPSLVKPQDLERAAAAFQHIVDVFPPAEWTRADRLGDPRGRDVAMISGDAWIAVGRLEEARGRVPKAVEVYRQIGLQFSAVPPIRLKALLAEAAARERIGGPLAATFLYAEIARSFAPVDSVSGETVRPALDAPLKVAADLQALGRRAAADSVLDAAESRLVGEARRRAGQPSAPELWTCVARIRAARGRPDQLEPALDALRLALAEPAAKTARPGLVLTLAEYCLQGRRPDSALVYAKWAEHGFDKDTKVRAMVLEGRVWEAMNADSAIAAYGRFIDAFPGRGDDVGLEVRFRRAELLEQQGNWEEARSELRALATLNPTHDLAFEASERIVAHHLKAGEKELAGIEARRALENLDHMLTTVQDEETLMRIRQVKTRILLAVGSWGEACAALTDLWGRYGQLDLGVSAGFRAAEVAEHELKDTDRAMRLYEELAARGQRPADQERARRELERLRHEERRG
jgi:tetratricopeptide (TPR) repeat protein